MNESPESLSKRSRHYPKFAEPLFQIDSNLSITTLLVPLFLESILTTRKSHVYCSSCYAKSITLVDPLPGNRVAGSSPSLVLPKHLHTLKPITTHSALETSPHSVLSSPASTGMLCSISSSSLAIVHANCEPESLSRKQRTELKHPTISFLLKSSLFSFRIFAC